MKLASGRKSRPPRPVCKPSAGAPHDQLAHGQRLTSDQPLDDAGRDPINAVGLAAAVAEGELVEARAWE
jgi:hypothetical protein